MALGDPELGAVAGLLAGGPGKRLNLMLDNGRGGTV